MLSMRAHLKQSSLQMKCSDIPPIQNCKCQEESSLLIYVVNESPFKTVKFSDEVLRYTPNNLSDEVTKIRCEMTCPDRLPDIPPRNLSDAVTKMRCEMKYPDMLSDIPPSGHRVLSTGNLTLLLTSSGQEWQFHIATDIWWSRMEISHC